jgi:hypothetical protein
MGVAAVDVVPTTSPSTSPSSDSATDPNIHAGQNPCLKKMCVVEVDSITEIVPNSKPIKIDNECFTGEIMLLIRTPDVDDVKAMSPDGAIPKRVSSYFKNYKRRFEFQFQIKLKKVPTGPLFLGCEVEEMIKISRWTKGLAGVLLAMIRRINSGFHYSWGVEKAKVDSVAIAEGKYENTHLSFPVEASMDRIVITKAGDTPPELGHELKETDQSVKRRRKLGAGSVDWNLDDTYTMCLWSAYCDWIKWKTLNVPGVRPFSLSTVTGQQPIYLSVYELQNITPRDYKKKKPPHNRQDLKVYTRIEFTHREMTHGGLAPRFQDKCTREATEDSIEETDSEMGSESDMGDYNKKVASAS